MDEARRRYQARCLESLEIALGRTPMYEAWRSRDPGARESLDARYGALPMLTKTDIRRHFPYGLVPQGRDLDGALARGDVCYVRTSGTADESVTNIWNQAWWDNSERASWSYNAHAAGVMTGAHREAILASALSVGPRSHGASIPKSERLLENFLFLNEYGSTAEWPKGHEERIRAEIGEYEPAVLEANPSLLARFARWAGRRGKDVFQPRLITLTYEFPSALHLAAIRRVFSSPIASSYGSTEAGYVFMECEQGRLHQNAEFCRVDLVPVEGLEDPGTGRMLVTTFRNEWFPLLRFDIGDIARVAPHACPCGRSGGWTLSSIEGRILSVFQAAGDRLVTHREMDQALASAAGLDEYRLDQEPDGKVRLRIVSEDGRAAQAVLRQAREAVSAVLGKGVEGEVVPSLSPEASGKFLLAMRHFPLAKSGAASGC